MWVSTYIAQLSAARAALYRKRACIAGHYGNSRASGNQEFCPPFLKAAEAQGERRGRSRWCRNTAAHTWWLSAASQPLRFSFNSQNLTFKEWLKRKALIGCQCTRLQRSRENWRSFLLCNILDILYIQNDQRWASFVLPSFTVHHRDECALKMFDLTLKRNEGSWSNVGKKSGHLFFTALMSILFVHGELGTATKAEPPMWVNINARLTMNTFDMLLNIHVDSLCLQRRVCSQCVSSDLDDSVQSSCRLVEQNDVDQMLLCNKSEAFSHSLRWAWQSAVSASPLAKLLLLLLCMTVRAYIITALGGLSAEGEAQAQFKGVVGGLDSSSLFWSQMFSY